MAEANEFIGDFVEKMQRRMLSIADTSLNKSLSIFNVVETTVGGYRSMHAHQTYKWKGMLASLQVVGEAGGGTTVGE